jgi:nicotinate phosphoribosyltransferase
VYKLAEIERDDRFIPVMKHSTGKETFPGRKQVWRVMRNGAAVEDVIGLADEPMPPEARPLLAAVMTGGVRRPAPSLSHLRARRGEEVQMLPPAVRRLQDGRTFPVRVSEALRSLAERI